MTSYLETHRDVVIYHEDDDLIVYRIPQTAPTLTAQLQ